MRLSVVVLWVACCVLLLVPLAVALPALPMVFSERELAAELRLAARKGDFSGLPDIKLRRKVQQLARRHGFHLSTSDVIVAASLASVDGMEQKGRVGYTLVLPLPILWLFDFEIVAVREEPVTFQDAT